MAIDYSKYISNGTGKKKGGIDYSKYLPSSNVGLNAPEEAFRAWKGDVPTPAPIPQTPIERPTADAYRALKGDVTLQDATRALKGDIQPQPPQIEGFLPNLIGGLLQGAARGFDIPQIQSFAQRKLLEAAPGAFQDYQKNLDILASNPLIAKNLDLYRQNVAGSTQPLPSSAFLMPEEGFQSKGAAKAGEIIGSVAPYIAGGGLYGAGRNIAKKAIGKEVAGTLKGKAIKGLAGGALLDLGVTGAQEAGKAALTPGEYDLRESLVRIGTNVALGGALGAGGEVIAPFIGQWARNLINRTGKRKAEVSRPLALPPSPREGQLALPAPRPIAGLLTPPTDFVAGFTERVIPRRFTPENPTMRLNRVLEEIKPEVMKMVTVESPEAMSRKSLYAFLSRELPDIPKEEIQALTKAEMKQLANNVIEVKHVPAVIDAARQAATKRGYDLDQLLEQATRRTPFLERAQPIAEKSRLAQAAGVTERPSIGRGPTEKVPFIESRQKPSLQQTIAQIQKVTKQAEKPVTQKPVVQAPEVTIPAKVLKKPIEQAGQKERGFTTTLKESPKTQQGFKEKLKGMYKPVTNKEVVDRANKRVSDDVEKAVSYVTSARVMTAEHIATGHRLIDEFQKQGNFERAVDIAEKLAEAGTKAGQSVQAYSIYNRLTPEGILVHAGRIVNKVNEKRTILAPEVKVTEDMAAKLTDLASTVQTMTGTKKVADDVISIVEKAKKGEKITDKETQTLQTFVQDASQFVRDIAPRKTKPQEPKPIPNKRVRDNVVDFLAAQEKAAKERLRAKGYRVMSGIPVDDFYDWSIIGASKLAKGTVKFADWSEAMVKELGEQIRPYLQQVYDKAVEVLDGSAKKITRTQLSEVEKITNRAIKDKAVSPEEAATIKKMAEKVATLSGDAKIEASQDLQGVLQALERPTIGQKISTVQTMAQLLNPKTWIRNLFGNELFYRMERLNKWTATPVDWARVKLFGGERSVTFSTGLGWEGFFNPAKSYLTGLARGVKAGFKGVSPEGLTTQYDLGPTAFSSKWNPATYLEKILGASMRGLDYAAYYRAKNQTILELANLRVINEGLTGQAKREAIKRYAREADERILNLADEYGKYVTFQDNNALSVGLQNMKRGINKFLPLAPDRKFGVGDLVLKYPRTPGALLMRAIEYSPFGLLRTGYILAGPIWKRDPNTREVMMSLTRAITGTTGFTIMGYILADAGILTGSSDKDKDVRELQRMTGQGQFRVNFSALQRFVRSGFDKNAAKPKEGDRLVTYDWMQPLALSLAIGANISQTMKGEKKGFAKILGEGYSIVGGALETITELSVLRGLKDAVEGYPGETVTDKLLQVVTTLPTSFTPTLGNQIRQYQDNTSRLTYDPDKLQELINKVKNKIPGLAGTLPPEYGTLGKQKEIFQGQGNTFFNVFLNPAFTSEYKLTPEAKTVVDLIERTGEKKVAPRAPSKYITIKGNRYDLTPQEYSQLQRRVGEETAKRLQKINPNAKDESQIKRIVDILNEAGKIARREIEKKHPEIQRK